MATTVTVKVMAMVTDILNKPYARMVIPEPDGSFSAEIVEFPGCIAMGDTAAKALDNLNEVAADWIGAALAQGQSIPEPMDAVGYSGKLVLRMPKSLHQKAALYAERDGVSLNQFIVTCLAERVGVYAQPMTLSAQSTQTVYAPIMLANVAVVSAQPHVLAAHAVSTGAATFVSPTIGRVRINA